MKLASALLPVLALLFVGVTATPEPAPTVDYAALRARHFPNGITKRAEDVHERFAELDIRLTTGEHLIGRDMSPAEAAQLFAKRCCAVRNGCCNGCC
ncbi:hypothetical protein M422DRAFT_34184 [Sphaerobolus stellatus SS14]|uniref:Uncharacterized protein n=1 Tax=Sphaerobolus stellatus (strain SS14) TaxID=990650 RepID=A0A0C9UPA4_SPHS4|nr:hypothetical protein M422DRAFT_37713 [Sphaerobolus stellatus SS14]KIJ36624.1 hypothetical protein M422DRAFT_34184 [Sphaerobolus stellatus SS14]